MGKMIGLSPDALYTRQRALMRMGVLTAVPGRGPGSGAPLVGENVAALLISLMTADTLQETDQRVRAMCKARPRENSECPWTGGKTFQDALGRVFDSDEAWKSFAMLSVYRGQGALIQYGRPDSNFGSYFDLSRRSPRSMIRISAGIDGSTIRQLFAAYRAITARQQ